MAWQMLNVTCPYLKEMWSILQADRAAGIAATSLEVMKDLSNLEHRAIAERANPDTLTVLSVFREIATEQALALFPPRAREI
ncbi:hypothetical protein [Methylorubrum sp. POS3]|uniref:hypothetical protein n=1 Tax=Methylorubrum sp. POS3 TaxID=2998492 RepID=UPI00372B3DFD